MLPYHNRLLCALLLLSAILLPYHRLATFQGLIITDDIFTSDIANGEFPIKVAVGQALKSGELPLWSPDICGGFPMVSSSTDPLTLLIFGLFSPLVALNLYILALLVIAAFGAYGYARSIGASRRGALLSGIGYTYSGYMVCQLKHIFTISTLCWFPLALMFLESAVHQKSLGSRRRLHALIGFSFVFGVQILAGFPQSAYICGLCYGLYMLFRVWNLLLTKSQQWRRGAGLFLGFVLASLLAVAIGMVQLLSMWEYVSLSDRPVQNSVEWATRFSYWPKNILTFIFPYINGDISDLSYKGNSIFWEDYGYVGLLTILLAFYAVLVGWRRRVVWGWGFSGLMAYLIVLGPATPVFGLFYRYMPGMNMFRFSTRFLFVVDFSLVVLAGLGLTWLEQFVAKINLSQRFRRLPALMATLLLTLAVADLLYFQLRQNPITDADEWLSPPTTVQAIKQDKDLFRIYSLDTNRQHMAAFQNARGWSGDLKPYVELRDAAQPNLNLLWKVGSADCYLGVYPRTVVDVWGGHNSSGIVQQLATTTNNGMNIHGLFFRLLKLFNVKYLLSPYKLAHPALREVKVDSKINLYQLADTLPRAFFVSHAYWVDDEKAAVTHFAAADFDPARQAILFGENPDSAADPIPTPSLAHGGSAQITQYKNNEVVVDVTAAEKGFLILSDTWYPGWKATLDGATTVIHRANFNGRAVMVPVGRHVVRFTFGSRSAAIGFSVTLAAIFLLVLCRINAGRLAKRLKKYL